MSEHEEARHGVALRVKLAFALLIVAIVMVVFAFAYFGPKSKSSFLDGSERLIGLSRNTMDEMVHDNTSKQKELLVSLIRHVTDSRGRHLRDFPLSLYEGDIERIRTEIEGDDHRRSETLINNFEIVAREMELRSLAEVDRRLDALGERQSDLAEDFASRMREANIVLAGALLAALLLLLGIGLHRAVISPIRRLRQGTQAVARGEFNVHIPVNSSDEVGGLTRDFHTMVLQLRESRQSIKAKNAELQEWNRRLESEVARKTEHLESAMKHLKVAQRQLVHAEKMVSIGRLAGGVAHEFNNVIGGIRGCAQEALEGESDPDKREPIEVILRASERAYQITEQLLHFSKQRALRRMSICLSEVARDALRLIEPEARNREVCIDAELDDLPNTIGDPDALHQVFLNLYTNALQAMRSGGVLTLRSKTLGESISISVQDSGPGVPEDQLDHIFEPFYTTKDTEAESFFKGTGLGLSVSYTIVEDHGGRLRVESTDKGAIFTVELPLSPKELPAQSEERRDEESSTS